MCTLRIDSIKGKERVRGIFMINQEQRAVMIFECFSIRKLVCNSQIVILPSAFITEIVGVDSPVDRN